MTEKHPSGSAFLEHVGSIVAHEVEAVPCLSVVFHTHFWFLEVLHRWKIRVPCVQVHHWILVRHTVRAPSVVDFDSIDPFREQHQFDMRPVLRVVRSFAKHPPHSVVPAAPL